MFTNGLKTYYDSIEISPAQMELICKKLKGMKFSEKEKSVLTERANFIMQEQ